MKKNNAIEKLNEDIPQIGLKKDDFIVAYPMDFYSGAGVYGLKCDNGFVKLCHCIEMIDGKIQVKEIGTADSRLMTQNDFKKVVNHKLFARVIIDNNLPSLAVNSLEEILLGE